jgi:hypothetical protein
MLSIHNPTALIPGLDPGTRTWAGCMRGGWIPGSSPGMRVGVMYGEEGATA